MLPNSVPTATSIFILDCFPCTLAFSKSAFAYPSTNPAFSRLAFKSFPLDFCCTAADSYLYYIIQNKLQKPNLHILMPNRTRPLCYINTSNAFCPFSTKYSKKQQKHHQPFKASKFIKLCFQWVGKVLIPLWLVPPLLSYKRGSDSCRKWRRGGRSSSFWRCYLRLIIIIKGLAQ